jgi:lipoprotein NlpD
MKRLLVLAISLCLLSCAYAPVRAPIGDRVKRPIPPGGYHTVVRGDTLYSIAWQYELDADKIADWNRIGPPYTIYTRQRLRLTPPPAPKPRPVVRRKPEPPPAPRVAPSRPKIASANRAVRKTPSQKPVTVRPSRPKTSAPIPAAPAQKAPEAKPLPAKAAVHRFHDELAWTWPARGRLLRRFDAKSPGKKGISIDGRPGDKVLAAASGKVVYSGSGLSGYGRLIIIKHNQRYLSAYAHNKKLLAKEGDWVDAGQLIAQMGSSGTNRSQLYFEIRRNQTSVDPLKILPRR